MQVEIFPFVYFDASWEHQEYLHSTTTSREEDILGLICYLFPLLSLKKERMVGIDSERIPFCCGADPLAPRVYSAGSTRLVQRMKLLIFSLGVL